MSDRLPAALRKALWSSALVSQHEDNATPTGSLQADRARAMAAALRWAYADHYTCACPPDENRCAMCVAIAALEQESEGT